MTDQALIVAARDPGGVRLTWYGRDGDVVVQATLSPKRAALIGLDLLSLALEPLFRARAETPAPQAGPLRGRATHRPRPAFERSDDRCVT
jgi:hypothetical protein